jgi:hypothetical protein
MFFAMLLMFIVFSRITHGRRRHFAHLRYHHRHWHAQHPVFVQMRPPVVAPPQPNAFEQLKRKYVDGDIDVEEYEAGVDALLRAPETRKVVP